MKKNDKFNNITSAMFNAYLISTLKYEKIKCFWVIQKIWKNKKINNKKKAEKINKSDEMSIIIIAFKEKLIRLIINDIL